MNDSLRDVMVNIIGNDPQVYWRFAIAIPWFGRRTLAQQVYWKSLFTEYVEQGGQQLWLLAGRLHREDDLPAAVQVDGIYRYWLRGDWDAYALIDYGADPDKIELIGIDFTFPKITNGSCPRREWWRYGVRHRDGDLPAVVTPVDSIWFQHGKIHRGEDKPAYQSDTSSIWYQQGIIHRDGDQPAFIDSVVKIWFHHGKFHRDNGPATVHNDGSFAWYQYNKIHRDDNQIALSCPLLNYEERYYFGRLHTFDHQPSAIYADSLMWHHYGEIVRTEKR